MGRQTSQGTLVLYSGTSATPARDHRDALAAERDRLTGELARLERAANDGEAIDPLDLTAARERVTIITTRLAAAEEPVRAEQRERQRSAWRAERDALVADQEEAGAAFLSAQDDLHAAVAALVAATARLNTLRLARYDLDGRDPDIEASSAFPGTIAPPIRPRPELIDPEALAAAAVQQQVSNGRMTSVAAQTAEARNRRNLLRTD